MGNLDLRSSNFNKVLQMMSLNNFAMAFVAIFIPVYLLKLGYSFQSVMSWFIIQHTTLLLTTFAVASISNRTGLVHTLHIRFILLLSYFYLLIFILKDHPGIFYFIPILIGMETAFYWMPLNTLLVRNTKEEGMGTSMSKFFVVPDMLAMFSPILGAIIAVHYGFTALFSFAMVLLFFTFLPILSLRKEEGNFVFSFENIAKAFQSYKKFFVPEIIDNMMEDAGIIWSIFIYLTLRSTIHVGTIATIIGVIALFYNLLMGKITDRWDKHKLLKIGAVLASLGLIINFVVGTWHPTKWYFYIAAILVTFCAKTFLIPYNTIIFNKVRTGDTGLVVLREVPVVTGRIILYTTAILLHNHLPTLFLLIAILFTYFWFLDTRKL